MVTVIFYHLLRSRYGIDEIVVEPGTLEEVIDQIIARHPDIQKTVLLEATLFVNQQKIMHLKRLQTVIHAGDRLVFTHFVGGG